jgi:hypothetical protein
MSHTGASFYTLVGRRLTDPDEVRALGRQALGFEMRGPKYFIGYGKHIIVLADWCSRCKGEGCARCDGLGSVITQDGKMVLGLVYDKYVKGRPEPYEPGAGESTDEGSQSPPAAS